jgi:sugar phosphate isomerase/epimerase
MHNSELNLGVSLFSFTNEWRLGQYTLESLLARLASSQIGPGVEVVGFQTIRGYPRVDAAYSHEFRRLMDKHRRVPTCLSANTDTLRHRHRAMTDEEKIADLGAQIDVAAQLGFPLMRIQIGLSEAVLTAAAAWAEKKHIRLGLEIHAPQGGDTPAVRELRQIYQRIGSPALGFIPDFSSTMRAVPAGQIAAFVKQGLSSALAALLVECWGRDDLDIPGRFAEFQRQALANGADPALVAAVRIIFHMFGRQAVESWRPILGQVFHVHAKFYEINAAGDEPSIPYQELLALFRGGGYRGYFSSEWEGSAFMLSTEVDAVSLVERQHALLRRLDSARPQATAIGSR